MCPGERPHFLAVGTKVLAFHFLGSDWLSHRPISGLFRERKELEVSCPALSETSPLNPSPEDGSMRWGGPWP